jgi:phosphoglycerate dehydrogenase-like enzyme
MKRAMLLLPPSSRDRIYSPEAISRIKQLVLLGDCADLVGNLAVLRPALAETDIILSGWGMMTLDREFLDAAPRLKAVFHGAGSVRGFLTEEFWKRDILLTSAYAANAVAVAEYTVAAIVFGMKQAVPASQRPCRERRFAVPPNVRGMYQAKIGIIGAGMVGSGVGERLKAYDVETFCYDPFLPAPRARELGITPMSIERIFETCDCVTLHAPNIPSTEGMITGKHFRSMKEGAVFINTARGAVVREPEMIEVLQTGRIFAFIDVTAPEPPAPDSPLYALPNVFLTPHMAGSCGLEARRQGEYVLEELRRFLQGEPARYPVTRDMMEWMA